MKLSARNIKGLEKTSTSENQKGFTLIELLVVIGILGILAAALVATINPFEQLAKGEDTKLRNMSVEMQNALVRYYTNYGSFPWQDGENTGSPCAETNAINADLNTTPVRDCIDGTGVNRTLIGVNELQQSFTSNDNDLESIQLNWDPAEEGEVTICYAPTSQAQKGAAETQYNIDGSTGGDAADCPDEGADDGVCHWCTQ